MLVDVIFVSSMVGCLLCLLLLHRNKNVCELMFYLHDLVFVNNILNLRTQGGTIHYITPNYFRVLYSINHLKKIYQKFLRDNHQIVVYFSDEDITLLKTSSVFGEIEKSLKNIRRYQRKYNL